MYPQTIGIGCCRRTKKEFRDDKSWYVCFQDEGQDVTWKKFKDEKEARAKYAELKEKKARMLYHTAVVE